MLAAEAAQQWTANFNPRSVSRDDFVGLYSAAFRPGSSKQRLLRARAASNRTVGKKKGAAKQRPR
jgi:hypothetical protein